MTAYLVPFAASFAFIFLRAFQQLNVVRGNSWLVVPTSVGMAACEVFTISAIVMNGFGWVVLALGLGGGLGSVVAMYIHKRFVPQKG